MDDVKLSDNWQLPKIQITWGKLEELQKQLLRDKPVNFIEKCFNNGWFISEDFDLFVMGDMASKDDVTIENALVETYRKNSSNIIERLQEYFHDRAHLIQSAFETHSQGNYNASIPLFLAQADGICRDMFGVKLFSRRNGTPLTKKVVERKMEKYPVGGILEAVVEVLISGSPLMLSAPEVENRRTLNPQYSILNRHEILHGHDKSYGNEINSLKAISLLSYLLMIAKKF